MDLTATILAACGVNAAGRRGRSTASTWRRSSPAGNPSRCARSAGGSTGSSGSRRHSATASGSSWSTAPTTWSGTSSCSTWRPISASGNNVAYEHPEILADLRKRLDAWEADVDAHPGPFVVK